MTEAETLDHWEAYFPGKRMPGMPEPKEGCCNGKVKDRRLRDLDIPGRYCGRPAGWGTEHSGIGGCKLHGGSTKTHVTSARKVAMEREIKTLAEFLGEETTNEPAAVMAERLVRKMQAWADAIETKVVSLTSLTTESTLGVEQTKAEVEILERGWDRLMAALQFALKFDLEARRFELERSQAVLILEAVRGVIVDPQAQLNDTQTARLLSNLRTAMEEIAPNLRPEWAVEFDKTPELVQSMSTETRNEG